MTSCPRGCIGFSVVSNRDQYGAYQQCLSCGWYKDADVPSQVVPKTVAPQARQKHKRYVFEKELYMTGAPMPKRENFTSADEHHAVYRRWYYWNNTKETA